MSRNQESQPGASSTSNQTGSNPQQDYEKLLKQVADRVWQLWREELRVTNERRSPRKGK